MYRTYLHIYVQNQILHVLNINNNNILNNNLYYKQGTENILHPLFNQNLITNMHFRKSTINPNYDEH